jgi:hypothetical protein
VSNIKEIINSAKGIMQKNGNGTRFCGLPEPYKEEIVQKAT